MMNNQKIFLSYYILAEYSNLKYQEEILEKNNYKINILNFYLFFLFKFLEQLDKSGKNIKDEHSANIYLKS